MLHQVISLTLVASMTAAAPSVPQGIPKNSTISGQAKAVSTTPLFVGNPYIVYTSPADSVASVTIGDAMRNRIESKLPSDYSIVTRQRMNADLQSAGFPPNAILTLGSATALGKQGAARIFVTSVMTKSPAGLYSLTIRVWGLNEEAGQTFKISQVSGQAQPDFGGKAAELAIPVIRAHADAKACIDQASSKPDKALESANKALKVVPNYGLAEYCVATMALAKDSLGADATSHFTNVTAGDPLSLAAWSQLAIIHQKKNDTTAAVSDYQSMLRQDPTNSELAKTASDLFRRYHRNDALNDLVDQQLKLDPSNTDWYDLKANGCLADNNYKCALDAMTQIWVVDSSRGDKDYFVKTEFIALSIPDTAAYLKWSRLGASKFATNTDIVFDLARAYTWNGKIDSAMVVTNKLIELDAPGQVDNVLQIVKAVTDAGQVEKILPLTNYFRKFGDDDAKYKFAGLGVAGQQALFQMVTKDSAAPPSQYARVVTIGDSLLAAGSTRPAVVEPINLFIGLASYQQIFPIQGQLQTQKTCDLAKQYDALLTRTETAFTAATASGNAQFVDLAKPRVAAVASAKAYAAAQIKALCSQ